MNAHSTVRKQFFRYVSQNILGMIGVSAYILADTFFIAQAQGADGIAALNLVLPVYSLILPWARCWRPARRPASPWSVTKENTPMAILRKPSHGREFCPCRSSCWAFSARRASCGCLAANRTS